MAVLRSNSFCQFQRSFNLELLLSISIEWCNVHQNAGLKVQSWIINQINDISFRQFQTLKKVEKT
jgi:hypothetical protein